MKSSENYRIVRLANGVYSVHSLRHAETFHPVIGPVAEAQALYVEQLGLRERFRADASGFVIWDVGLGAAANAITVLRGLAEQPGSVQLVSFDHTLEPLRFAMENAGLLGYLGGIERPLEELLLQRATRMFLGKIEVNWRIELGDFPTFLAGPGAQDLPKPHAILFDAYSPAKNPSMWTQPLFSRLFQLLAPGRPCALPTYSRSTMLRVTLLLAGFYVGSGHATGEKEETTMAANTLDLIREPLDRKWLQRARRSTSAEPLAGPRYRQARLSAGTWERLQRHPQFD
ncbi:MAG: methyltransferase [Verrucomicrobia bacterium]|nr:methyltransferase [Verrucomicrobiota bacterium]